MTGNQYAKKPENVFSYNRLELSWGSGFYTVYVGKVDSWTLERAYGHDNLPGVPKVVGVPK